MRFSTHLAGWRPRQVRHHRLLQAGPEKTNVTNGSKRHPIRKHISRHQHCTSALRKSQLSKKKQALAVAVVGSQLPLAPDASAQHKFLPARYMFNTRPKIEAP